jgi:hypothetical protein
MVNVDPRHEAKVARGVALMNQWGDDEDPVGPARGIAIGAVIGIVMWVVAAVALLWACGR